MQYLIDRLMSHESGKAPSPSQHVLPAWAPARHRRDPIEQFLSRCPDRMELSDFARDATRMCTRVDGRNHYRELLVIPILQPGPVPLAHDPQIWQEASEPLLEELIQLFPSELHFGFFRAVTSVEDICGMPWQAIRAHLEPPCTLTGNPTVQEFERLYGRLPGTVPHLGFVVVRASCRYVWPSTWLDQGLTIATNTELRKHQVLLRAAQILQWAAWETSQREPDRPQVLPVRTWSHGIGEGICAWLQMLHAKCTVTGYHLALDPRNLDLRSLEINLATGGQEILDCDDPQPLTLRIGIRRHALSPNMWEEILNTLHGIADFAPPSDTSASSSQTMNQ